MLRDEQRVGGRTQEATEEAGEDVIVGRDLVGRCVETDAVRQAASGSASGDVVGDRTETGEVVGGVLRIGARPTVPDTGQHVVHRHGVRVVGVRERAELSQLVGMPSQQRQVLADQDTRHARGNRRELAADLRGRIRLHVPAVLVSRRAEHEQHDARLGTPERTGRLGHGRDR